jgi:long-chain fatty acid transport protein
MAMDCRSWFQVRLYWMALLGLAICPSVSLGQGAVFPGAGPINRSMGGASTAAPIDAAGALYWNPASITGLDKSEMSFGTEFLYGVLRMSSTLPADSFGPGIPATTLAGETRSDSGIFVIPTIALVYKPEESPMSFGFGVFSAGGFYSNFPGSLTNPLLTPPPPNGVGVGPVYSRFGLIETTTNVAYQINDQISIGLGPAVTAVDLGTDPSFFAAPDDADKDGFRTFPNGTHSRLHWGLGFQGGIFIKTPACWNFGLSYKSKTWFETFQFDSHDELGFPRTLALKVQFPQIMSAGVSYTGLPGITWAADVRYVDYRTAKGFGDPAEVGANGAAIGIGWRSVFAVATGVQYQLNPGMSFRVGYFYTQDPIPDRNTFFNLEAPAFYQHVVSVGATFQISEHLSSSMAVIHGFKNAIEGPIFAGNTPIPGSNVRMVNFSDGFLMGMTVKF